MTELALRTVFSLGAVLGTILLLTRVAGKRYRGRAGGVQVLGRQQLSRGSAVAVVAVGSRVLVLGTTEQQVGVLAELDPEDVADVVGERPEPAPGRRHAGGARRALPVAASRVPVEVPVEVPVGAPVGASAGASVGAPAAPVAAARVVRPEGRGPYADFAAQLLDELQLDPAPVLTPPVPRRPTPAEALLADEATPAPAVEVRRPGRHSSRAAAPAATAGGALAGSLLSAQTWRQTMQALRRAS